MITIPEEEAAAVRFAEENEEPSFERAKVLFYPSDSNSQLNICIGRLLY